MEPWLSPQGNLQAAGAVGPKSLAYSCGSFLFKSDFSRKKRQSKGPFPASPVRQERATASLAELYQELSVWAACF